MTATLPADVLRDALTAALVAAATDKLIPTLNAVQIVKDGSRLTFRATDRYRLVRVQVALTDAPDGDWQVLLATPDVKSIVAALPKDASPVTCGPTDNRFGASIEGGGTFQCPLFDGDFPRTDSIIPTTTTAVDQIAFNPKRLADVVKLPGRVRNQQIVFKLNGDRKPVRSEWTDGAATYLYLLMPERIVE